MHNIKFLDLQKQKKIIQRKLDENIKAVLNHSRFIR